MTANEELIAAGDWLATCAQTTGGVEGQDTELMLAVDRWVTAKAAALQSQQPAPDISAENARLHKKHPGLQDRMMSHLRFLP